MFDTDFLNFRLEKRSDAGLLVAFCGLDGSGKTTMIRRLADRQGPSTMVIQQPSALVRSLKLFRRFHDDPERPTVDYRSLVLFTTGDRLLQADEVIRPALSQSGTVIADRYIFCTIANMIARGYDADRWIHEIVSHIPQPDVTFFMDTPVSVAETRIRQRPEEKDIHLDLELMAGTAAAYKAIASHGFMHRIDSFALTPDECFAEVQRVVDRLEIGRAVPNE